ncbi:MAG TPA: hypothetical protein VEA37_04925, partial [Flavobacterium sp.]|nr:hypothetical protein [Flavobacterium sp.]
MNAEAIDNFNLLEPLLEYNSADTFYYLQILQRKKDKPTKKSVKVIDNIFLTAEKSLRYYEPRIREMCTFFSARAYLRLNRRSFNKVALLMNKRLAELLMDEKYALAKKAFSWAAGNT